MEWIHFRVSVDFVNPYFCERTMEGNYRVKLFKKVSVTF